MRWYLKDKYGYPIEFIKSRGKCYKFFRILCQNIWKVTG